jgi:hypothetical protein
MRVEIFLIEFFLRKNVTNEVKLAFKMYTRLWVKAKIL